MAELKNRMRRHMQAARLWLGQAEQSFEEENEIRGDLNLMLARAELESARAAKAPHRAHRLITSLFHGVLALSVAGLLLAVLFSGFGFGDAKPDDSVIPVQSVGRAVPVPLQQNADKHRVDPEPKASVLTESSSTVPTAPIAVQHEIEDPPQRNVYGSPPQPAGKPEGDLPPVEMQQLLRAAGKSLRGK